MTNPQAIQELMNKYEEYQIKWIAEYGDSQGFDKWFTAQVIGDETQPL